MILDWMWLGEFFKGRNVCVCVCVCERGEEKNKEKYCTWCYVMKNGERLLIALFLFVCIDL